MPHYAVDFIESAIGASVTFGSHGASNATQLRRHKVIEFSFSVETPADQTARITGQRYSAAGTSTAVVPTPLFALEGALTTPAMLGVAGENHSVEPTYTATLIVFNKVVIMRNQLLYYAPPGAEIVVPGTNASGIGWFPGAISSGTPAAVAQVILEE